MPVITCLQSSACRHVTLHCTGASTPEASDTTPSGDPAEKHESDAPAIDVLYDGHQIHVLESRRVHTNTTHGTGPLLRLPCLLRLFCMLRLLCS